MMNPIGWTAESVRVTCGECGDQATLDWPDYFVALSGEPVECPTCGRAQQVADHRKQQAVEA
jgi:ribosomal protein S27AE